ncbi:hypothetical protein FBZ33_0549 [Micromonospora sp. A202]|uniref:hypothetical protein n=1 Tax=Micromonospora sp. A202 TaxID=2572899 RepID=UPI001151B000|nr:hypothetical protein [Micromonospora sp. A202]TQJ20353.1 hypothetical protein FBZ33_0549 [Micromonospora sp. A202]
MRDEPTFVEHVHRDLRDVRWPEPEEIRATARRRRRRTAALAAVAVLAAVTGPAYALTERTSAPPTAAVPAATQSPARAEIPLDSLLTVTEVPVKGAVLLGDAGLGEVVRLDPMLQRCGDDRGVPAVPAYSRYSRSQTLLSPTRAGRAPARVELSQDVYRVDPLVSARLFTHLRALLDACPEWHVVENVVAAGETTPIESKHAWETAASNFAGDESILVRHVPFAPGGPASRRTLQRSSPVEMTVVVRVGDLVTVLVPDPGLGLGDADLEALGRTAARRLCPAANPAC